MVYLVFGGKFYCVMSTMMLLIFLCSKMSALVFKMEIYHVQDVICYLHTTNDNLTFLPVDVTSNMLKYFQ